MGVIVRIADPAAMHLKRHAEQMGRQVVASGGGVKTAVLDGYIVRAQGNKKRAVVTVLGMAWSFCSPIPSLYTFGSTNYLVRDVRVEQPLGRFALDQAGDTPTQMALNPGSFRPFQGGVALTVGDPRASVTSGAWSTADSVIHPGVILCPGVRSTTVGGRLYLDTVIYRATAGRKTLKSSAGNNQVEFRAPGPSTSKGELAYVVLSAAAMGFSPGTPSEPSFIMAPSATELSPGEGLVAVRSVVRLSPPETKAVAHFVRYSVDFETSTVRVLWRYDLEDATPGEMYAAGGTIKALVVFDDGIQKHLSFDPAAGFVGAVALAGFSTGVTRAGSVAYVVDDAPWFFCPRHTESQVLRHWTAPADLDVVLVSPAGAVVSVSTPGYYVQRGTNRIKRSGTSNDGTIAPPGSGVEGCVAYYGQGTFAEFGVSNACVYAPGILAVVLCPEADFALPTQRRYLGLINASTGTLLHVAPTPICNRDVWYGVSLSCYEQGKVNVDGDVIIPGALLVSIWRPYDDELDGALPDPASVGIWVTVDAGESLVPLYQLETYTAMAPIQRAAYLGSPLLPAKIGQTRGQWL